MRAAVATIFDWLTTENGTADAPRRRLNSRGVLALVVALSMLGWMGYAEGLREYQFRAKVQTHESRLESVERARATDAETLKRIEDKLDTLLLNLATRRVRQEQ